VARLHLSLPLVFFFVLRLVFPGPLEVHRLPKQERQQDATEDLVCHLGHCLEEEAMTASQNLKDRP
jgi:hypothetical protein